MTALGPGDLTLVFECLRGALSQQPGVQKQAEAALQALEARPGFCSCLAVSRAPGIVRLGGGHGSWSERAAALPPAPHSCESPALPRSQEIIASKDADHSARWLAAVHFKNSISKYWRSRLPG